MIREMNEMCIIDLLLLSEAHMFLLLYNYLLYCMYCAIIVNHEDNKNDNFNWVF